MEGRSSVAKSEDPNRISSNCVLHRILSRRLNVAPSSDSSQKMLEA